MGTARFLCRPNQVGHHLHQSIRVEGHGEVVRVSGRLRQRARSSNVRLVDVMIISMSG